MKYEIYGVTLMPYDDCAKYEYGNKEVNSEEEIKQYCKDLEKRNNEKRKKNNNSLRENVYYKKIED